MKKQLTINILQDRALKKKQSISFETWQSYTDMANRTFMFALRSDIKEELIEELKQ